MPGLVLDTWAIMAWLKGQQTAAAKVRLLLDAAEHRQGKLMMNVINLCEVFYLSVKARDMEYGQRVLENLRSRIATISAGDELVMAAANLKARHAISYADAFAAATAMQRQVPLVTGDPEFRALAEQEKTLQLEWIAG
ncbi:MAG TPA: PIN domain-containing protein [Bryobacteraceae bacterium]|nr:PIN domain-containing protein [Bryobacteraceae bacterium]